MKQCLVEKLMRHEAEFLEGPVEKEECRLEKENAQSLNN